MPVLLLLTRTAGKTKRSHQPHLHPCCEISWNCSSTGKSTVPDLLHWISVSSSPGTLESLSSRHRSNQPWKKMVNMTLYSEKVHCPLLNFPYTFPTNYVCSKEPNCLPRHIYAYCTDLQISNTKNGEQCRLLKSGWYFIFCFTNQSSSGPIKQCWNYWNLF